MPRIIFHPCPGITACINTGGYVSRHQMSTKSMHSCGILEQSFSFFVGWYTPVSGTKNKGIIGLMCCEAYELKEPNLVQVHYGSLLMELI